MGARKTILLVEDEALIARSQQKHLEKYGYEVITAYSGEEAIEAFRHNGGIHLILMDIDLGRGINGADTARMILNDNEIPVVFLSSHTEKEIVEKTEEITSYGYVVKNSGITVIDASIKMAFKLFEAREKERETYAALRASEEKFSKAFMAAPEATTIASMEDGRYIDVNEVFCRTTGFRRDEVIGRTSADLGVWVDMKDRERYIEDLTRNGFLRDHETRYRMRGGEVRLFLVSSEIIHLSGTRCSLNYITDITDRRRMEELLQRSEESIRIAVESGGLGTWSWDLLTNRLTWSDSCKRMFGIPLDTDMTYEHFIDALVPGDRESAQAVVMESLGKEIDDIKNEYRVRWPDGTVHRISAMGRKYVDGTGRPVRVEGVAMDITGRKEAEDVKE
jgi:PAS domain S-box-containing protein